MYSPREGTPLLVPDLKWGGDQRNQAAKERVTMGLGGSGHHSQNLHFSVPKALDNFPVKLGEGVGSGHLEERTLATSTSKLSSSTEK